MEAVDEVAFLGHRRLSIVDLSLAGSQPMTDESGSVWLTYNGEIYNFLELRRRLEANGHRFRSQTDSEVLVHLYEEEGLDLLRHLNGMFAFAIWDRRLRRLFLARDEFGIKPVYYVERPDGVAFASEAKALFELPEVSPDLDPLALWQSMSFRYVPGTRTLFARVQKLLPGHYLSWDPDRGPVVRRWSQSRPTRSAKGMPAASADDLRLCLQGAVHRQLMADVPVGSLLSGGLDSSFVTVLMAASAGSTRAYTVAARHGDHGSGVTLDRLEYVEELAGAHGLDVSVTPPMAAGVPDWDLLDRAVWHLEEPVSDSAILNIMRLAKAAREDGTPVLLCGHGADEMFGGYRRYQAALLLRYLRWTPQLIRRASVAAARLLRVPYRGRHLLSVSCLPEPDDLINVSLLNGADRVRRLLHPDLVRHLELDDVFGFHREALGGHRDRDLVDQAMLLDQATFLVDQNLLYMDKLSMAHSIETRVPFLDAEVAELAQSLPRAARVTFRRTKALLVEAARPVLPDTILRRPKMGFGVNMAEWWTNGSSDWYRERLESAETRGWFNREAVRQEVEGARAGSLASAELIFSVLLTETWARAFLSASHG